MIRKRLESAVQRVVMCAGATMSQLLRFPSSVKRDPAIDVWMREHSGALGAIARRWFEVMRDCGDDVRSYCTMAIPPHA